MSGKAEVRWRTACLALAVALIAASTAPAGTGALFGQAFSRSAATPVGTPAPCPVTTPELAPVPTPSSPEAYSYDASVVSAYYVSPDRTLWVTADAGWRRGGNKVGWLRPPGEALSVSGRRLDGAAPPLGVDIPDGYPWNLQVSALYFPTGGCWEVTGEAAGSTLRFVVAVDPGPTPPPPPVCNALTDAVAASEAIFVGRVTRSAGDPTGYLWQTLDVPQVIKPRLESPFTGYFLLQDARREPPLQVGHTYLIFAYDDPPAIACPAQTLAEVGDDDLLRLLAASEPNAQPLWSGTTLVDVVAEIEGRPSEATPL